MSKPIPSNTRNNKPQPKYTQNSILQAQGLDLTGLDEALGLLASDEELAASRGKPLSLSLDKVIEDPDQPRKQFDPETLQTLTDSIAIHGVKSPISVRSADQQGQYRINFGARRRRAAVLAGLTEIPAFIDDDHDQYAQVVENIQRDDFRPMEIARFLKQEIDLGQKATDIAKRLGQSKHWFSKYHSINELPEYIKTRATAGDIPDYSTLYEIGLAAKKDPEHVATFIETTPGHIARGAFKDFLQKIVPSDNPIAESKNQSTPSSTHPATKTQIKTADLTAPTKNESIDVNKRKEDRPDPSPTSNQDEKDQSAKIPNPAYPITDPVIVISVKGGEGILRFDIVGPTGFGFVQYPGEDETACVAFNEIRIIRLINKS